MIEAWFDGVCEPFNPGGHGAYGIDIRLEDESNIKHGVYVGFGKEISNNVAEYQGFIHILTFLLAAELNKEEIIIQGDSKLVIEQMKGKWGIRQGIYVPYAKRAKKLFKKFKNTILQWIPREENDICDKLAKDVLRNKKIKFRIQPE